MKFPVTGKLELSLATRSAGRCWRPGW